MHLDGFVCKLYHRTNSRTGCSAAFPNSLLGCLGRRQFVFPCEMPHSDRVTASDMPIYRPFLQLSQVFTPRLRGCTCLHFLQFVICLIYPAHAGMSPPNISAQFSISNLPCARRDVPFTRRKTCSIIKSTPRLRGCTRRTALLEREDRIYPAQAGMSYLSYEV